MAKDTLAPLKFTVISLGMVLIGGLIFLSITAYHKITTKKAHSSGCITTELVLPAGEPQRFELEGTRLRVVIKQDKTHYQMLTLDSCSGKILQSLPLSFSGNVTHP